MTYPHPTPEAIAEHRAQLVAVQGLKHLHEEMKAQTALLAEILAALKHQTRPAPAQPSLPGMAPRTAQAPQADAKVYKIMKDGFSGTSKAGKPFCKVLIKIGEEWVDIMPGPKHAETVARMGKFSTFRAKLGEIKRGEYNGKPQASAFCDDFEAVEIVEKAAPPPSEFDAPQDPMGFPVDDSVPF